MPSWHMHCSAILSEILNLFGISLQKTKYKSCKLSLSNDMKLCFNFLLQAFKMQALTLQFTLNLFPQKEIRF